MKDYMNQADSFIISVTAVKAVCTCKIVRLLPHRHMVHLIMELVGITPSPLPPLMVNGVGYDTSRMVQQGFVQGFVLVVVLVPLLFSIYTSDLPTTVSRTYACANDLAIMHADGD